MCQRALVQTLVALWLALAASGVVAVAVATTTAVIPEQLKISYGRSDDEMSFFFATPNMTTPSDYAPVVMVGRSPSALNLVVPCTSQQSSCFTLSSVKHVATVRELKASTRYYYRVGDPVYGMSSLQSFVSKRHSDDRSPLRVLAFGDLGLLYSNYTIADWIGSVGAGDVELSIHVGDASYADIYINATCVNATCANGTDLAHQGEWYEGLINTWYQLVEPATAAAPYILGVGNHEFPCDFAEYLTRDINPPSDSGSQFYFSFNVGRVHFVYVSTENQYAPPMYINSSTAQYEWVQRDLDHWRRRSDWVVVLQHRPMYCSYNSTDCMLYPSDSDIGNWTNPYRSALESLYTAAGVDLVLTGHVHSYEATHPVYQTIVDFGSIHGEGIGREYVDPQYPVYVVSGGPGNDESPGEPLPLDVMPDWTAARISCWTNPVNLTGLMGHGGYSVLTFDGPHSLSVEYLRSMELGFVEDSFTIWRKHASNRASKDASEDASSRE